MAPTELFAAAVAAGWLRLPEPACVLLFRLGGGTPGPFAEHQHLSTAACEGWLHPRRALSDLAEDVDQLLETVLALRLKHGNLTLVEALPRSQNARTRLRKIAQAHDAPCYALICRDDGEAIADEETLSWFSRLPAMLGREGFAGVATLTAAQFAQLRIEIQPSPADRRDDTGPFDLIGDVHGCLDELQRLLIQLGYQPEAGYRHRQQRRALFLGDLVDRGPASLAVFERVREMVAAGSALCLKGNHEVRFAQYLQGGKLHIRHGLETTVAEFEALPADEQAGFRARALAFIGSLPGHLWLDQGRLAVAHAGLKEAYIGRDSGRIASFALYGDTTGETDDWGLPVRRDWAQAYRGTCRVVYGHVPVQRAEWINGTLDIDTGCVFGGALTALRWPEGELLSVPAAQTYWSPRTSAC